MRDYKQYPVWRDAQNLVLGVYTVSASLPGSETYGLQSQIRRAAVSIPANLAEGAGRDSEADFRQFLDIAIGSINELETLLILSKELDFPETHRIELTLEEMISVRKQIIGLHKRLKRKKVGR